MPEPVSISDDLNDVIRLLIAHDVDYLIVGSYVLALYVVPRATKDIDFFVRKSTENVGRLASALKEIGITIPEPSQVEFVNLDDGMMTIGMSPNRVDFLNHIKGIEFDSAWEKRVKAQIGTQRAWFISREDYIASKRAAGRTSDLQDLALIEKYEGKKP